MGIRERPWKAWIFWNLRDYFQWHPATSKATPSIHLQIATKWASSIQMAELWGEGIFFKPPQVCYQNKEPFGCFSAKWQAKSHGFSAQDLYFFQESRCLWGSNLSVLWTPRAWIIGSCELPNVHARNNTWVLFKSIRALLTCESSP